MGTTWGRRPITNADKRPLTMTKYIVNTADGDEERIDRRPMGKVEKFVDPQGNVTSEQMYADGDPKRHETEIRKRASLHRKGFVEHAKCPLKYGTRYKSPITQRDFDRIADMPAEECKYDVKAMSRVRGELIAGEACPHIEALIRFRVKQADDAYRKRNAFAAAREREAAARRDLEAAQLEMVKEQLAERKRKRDEESPIAPTRRKPKDSGEES